jgi:CheY-like chemotaxis protein
MKKILLVDDDATIREIYRKRFVRAGYEVETVEDGLLAAKALRTIKPDLVILDLMMPRLSGVDVLRFIRSQHDLAQLPVVIFTNAYLSELAEAANGLCVQRAIVKSECPPDRLVEHVNDIFANLPSASAPSTTTARVPEKKAAEETKESAHVAKKARDQFLDNSANTMAALRALYREFLACEDPRARNLKLEDLYRKVHFVSTISGMAECHQVALLAGAFEALTFELHHRPEHIGHSTLHTITTAMDFLELLLENARAVSVEQPLAANVLVVDDDPLSNHLAVAALRRAKLNARAADNPLMGLEMATRSHYDLILLDIEMPTMNGFDVCRKLRTMPGYKKTPVIYVTAHNDFESRSASIVAGGNDLIGKPIFPVELALKAVMHLLMQRLPATVAAAKANPPR